MKRKMIVGVNEFGKDFLDCIENTNITEIDFILIENDSNEKHNAIVEPTFEEINHLLESANAMYVINFYDENFNSDSFYATDITEIAEGKKVPVHAIFLEPHKELKNTKLVNKINNSILVLKIES